MRRRRGGLDRAGVRAGARRRPGARPTAASSCSTGRSAQLSGSSWPSSSSRCCSRRATTSTALERLKQKPSTRILDDRERRRSNPGERDYKRVLGGLLVQERDWDVDDREGMQVVCGRPDEMAWGDLLFAWRDLQARRVERDRARTRPADDRDRRGPDEPGRRGADRAREGARARSRPGRGGARLGRVLPVRRRPAARARRGRDRRHPAGRLEAATRRWSRPSSAPARR